MGSQGTRRAIRDLRRVDAAAGLAEPLAFTGVVCHQSFCYSMDFVVDGTSRAAGDAASVGRVDTAYLLLCIAEQSLRVFAGGLPMLESMPLLRSVGQVRLPWCSW